MNNPEPRKVAGSAESKPAGGEVSNRLLTVPNVLCAMRLFGSVVLVILACRHRAEAFLWLFLALAMTDWLDGKLAIILNQRTVFGARLDSWADAAMYAALLFGSLWMHGATLRPELAWVGAALGTYALSTAMGFWKYKCWPSYHTRAAKISWLLITVGAISLLGGWAVWPLRVALGVVTITNLEALLITILSPAWRADVVSVYHVRGASQSPERRGWRSLEETINRKEDVELTSD